MKKISNPLSKVNIKKPERKAGRKAGKAAGKTAESSAPGSFGVNIRTSEPILTLVTDTKKSLPRDLLWYAIYAAVPMAALAVLLDLAYALECLPGLLAGFVIYIGYSVLRDRVNTKWRVISAAIIGVLLIVALVVLRKYIFGGCALIADQIFEYAEYSQAYVYDMLPVGEAGNNDPEMCMMAASLWVSAMTGLITALPGQRFRRLVNVIIMIAVMLVLAFLGTLPTVGAAAALVLLFLLSCGGGSVLASIPLLLIAGILIAALAFVDPGESYTVSRANENIRDRFAFRSAYVESYETPEDELFDEEEEDSDNSGFLNFLGGDDEEIGSMLIFVIIGIIILAIAILIFLLHRRLDRKRKLIRKDIDSHDPNTAIGAMFPYLVRWLRIFGIETGNEPYSASIPAVRENMMSGYAERYENMLTMWKEAVYSDHELTEADRLKMESFMKETVSAAKNKANWKDKLRIRLKYAW